MYFVFASFVSLLGCCGAMKLEIRPLGYVHFMFFPPCSMSAADGRVWEDCRQLLMYSM
jgi:hypothetical protein